MHAYSAFCVTLGVQISIGAMLISTSQVMQNAEYAFNSIIVQNLEVIYVELKAGRNIYN